MTRPHRRNPAEMEHECRRFNEAYQPGDVIHVWTGPREGVPVERTVSDYGAHVLGGHTPVVYIVGGGGSVALTHVQEWT